MTKPRRKATPAAPRRATRTEEQTEADARAYDARKRAAGRQAFRYLMTVPHGCTGRSCASERHPGDLAGLTDALMALGVIPDPQANWAIGPGYSVKNRRRSGGEPSHA